MYPTSPDNSEVNFKPLKIKFPSSRHIPTAFINSDHDLTQLLQYVAPLTDATAAVLQRELSFMVAAPVISKAMWLISENPWKVCHNLALTWHSLLISSASLDSLI